MRRRDLLAIAATQQVREMQEGAAINYNPRSAFACDRTPEPTLGKTIQLCFYLKKETSESYVQRNIFNNSAHGYSISTDRNICVCYYPKEGNLCVSSYNGINIYELKSPQTGIYNLCVTIDHEGLSKVYRDGALVSELKQRAITSTSPLFIGLGAANMATPPNLAISNSRGFAGNVMLLRIFNYALSAAQIAALYNNGKLEEYLLPAADKVGCIAEYLPQNLVTAHDGDMTDKTPIAWLDSAKQLPLNDEYLPPLLQSVGGYDLTALGQPEIVEKARIIQKIQLNNPMNISDFTSIYGGYVNIIDGNIRVLCDGRANSYGYAIATKIGIFQANIGDTIKWRCYTRTSADYAATNYFVGATNGGLLYNTRSVLANTEWVLTESTFTVSHENTGGRVLNQFWIMKNYGYTGSGYIEVKNIEIEIYNK